MAYKVLELTGYYRLKKSIKHKHFIRRILREDAEKKKRVLAAIDSLSGNQLSRQEDASDIIVSLTSYGVRVNDTLPYTLYSLLQQTRKPNRIVVWLDNINWDEEKLPPVLKKFEALGIEFCFVEDLQSYKKLIPALKRFPDNVIITVDDDVYYAENVIERLLLFYEKSDKRTVLGTWASITRSKEGTYLPYSQWISKDQSTCNESECCLIGCGGILYPPHIFDEEIMRKDIFMQLAPTADDLWLWAMEKRLNLNVIKISGNKNQWITSVNRVDDYETDKEGSLYYINELKGANDIQLAQLVKYYQLKPTSL